MSKFENKSQPSISQSNEAELHELKILLAEKETIISRMTKTHAEEIERKNQEIANLKARISHNDEEVRLIKNKRMAKRELTPDIFMLDSIEKNREAKYERKIRKLEDELEDALKLEFTRIAVRYLNATRKKNPSRRKQVKDNLHDIMNELKLQVFFSQELQEKINAFDDENSTPQQISVAVQSGGTFVQNQLITKE